MQKKYQTVLSTHFAQYFEIGHKIFLRKMAKKAKEKLKVSELDKKWENV